MKYYLKLSIVGVFIVGCPLFAANVKEKPFPSVALGPEGNLVYLNDKYGNRIPDFSHCGYMGQDKPIPDVPIRIVVHPREGDETQHIQAAIDYVASLSPGADGIRGAVLLLRGRYEVWGSLNISTSGIVLRGQGMDKDETTLVAAGQGRRTLIKISGKNDLVNPTGKSYKIKNAYVPVGARSFHLNTTEGLRIGDKVKIIRPSTKEWIEALDMSSFGGGLGTWRGWKSGSRNLIWDRVIKSINGDLVVVDAPITTAVEARFGGAVVQPYTWPGRISNVGVENLRCESYFDPSNPKDEEHSWMAVTMENIENAWVRQVTMKNFAGSAVAIWESSKWVTVQDCVSLSPVSENGGYRRHTFFTMGQLTLFLHCWAEQGRHDFSTGHCAAGPNAFVQCKASLPYASSGPIESWSSGTLYDNVNIDGGALKFCNLGSEGQGIGWAATNSVMWQCNATVIRCDKPPTAWNWAFGCWGELSGDGIWRNSNGFVEPICLFEAQLADRLGSKASKRLHIMPLSTSGYTSPTVEVAEAMTTVSREPAPKLLDYIDEAAKRYKIPCEPGETKFLEQIIAERNSLEGQNIRHTNKKKLSVINGWLTCDGELIVGDKIGVNWWRGNIRPSEAPSFGVGVTRFVPGRTGPGFTDDLDTLTDTMLLKKEAALDYNYGLWYDRRRDDHERTRRMDANVLPPFYELPFRRSGKGTAWDGLSKYDLRKYNPWYWGRLREFADLCDRKGLVLFHQNYFQHNILEAGAHWADFPWRSANNINNVGFPEPPPYAGNKRIFMDELFYDVTHPVRRSLHRAYIRKCLNNFSDNTNVIQLIGAEYTGPLHFVKFWLDTIIEWQKETVNNPLIGLSCTKDVQDAVLEDPVYRQVIDVIDIRYWWYQSNGKLYAPKGGQHLAPRQHARLLNPKRASFEQVFRAIYEYRTNYPDKVVLYSADSSFGWATFMAGGSIPNVPNITNLRLSTAIPHMKVQLSAMCPPGQYVITDTHKNILVYSSIVDTIQLDLSNNEGIFNAYWIDPNSNKIISNSDSIEAGVKVKIPVRFKPCVLWLSQ